MGINIDNIKGVDSNGTCKANPVFVWADTMVKKSWNADVSSHKNILIIKKTPIIIPIMVINCGLKNTDFSLFFTVLW